MRLIAGTGVVVGVVFVAAGLILGLSTVNQFGVPCGTAFHSTGKALVAHLTNAPSTDRVSVACAAARSVTVVVPGGGLVVAGLVTLVVSAVARYAARSRRVTA